MLCPIRRNRAEKCNLLQKKWWKDLVVSSKTTTFALAIQK